MTIQQQIEAIRLLKLLSAAHKQMIGRNAGSALLMETEEFLTECGHPPLDRVEHLRTELRQHCHRYYCLDAPNVSDDVFDQLFNELLGLEKRNPDLLTPDSPTQVVGCQLCKKEAA